MPRFPCCPRSSPTSTRIDLDGPTPSLVADPEPAVPTPPTPLQVVALRCALPRPSTAGDKRKRADPSGPASFLQALPELAAAPRTTVRVATWNVRHLSQRRPPAALALLCDVLCRFDLIAMQARPQLWPRDAFTLGCARPRGLKLSHTCSFQSPLARQSK
jgi:hypothetical protein